CPRSRRASCTCRNRLRSLLTMPIRLQAHPCSFDASNLGPTPTRFRLYRKDRMDWAGRSLPMMFVLSKKKEYQYYPPCNLPCRISSGSPTNSRSRFRPEPHTPTQPLSVNDTAYWFVETATRRIPRHMPMTH